jgi:hypothetical protein
MEALALRDCASVIAAGKALTPLSVLPGRVAWKEKMLSFAAVSPWVPSSKNCCDAEPPMAVRSAVTAMPVLVGLRPGVTVTVNSVVLPACTVEGLAAAVAVGLVCVLPTPRIEMSSMARAWPLVVVVPVETE